MTDLTETSLHSEQVLDGVLLKVHRDRVRLPDGRESVREWIDHPGAAAVVPFLDDGSVLLVRQFRFPSRRVFLEIPAGKLDPEDGDPADAARRELEEETGWRAESVEYLGSLSNCIGYSNEVIHLYMARRLTRGEQALADGELVEIVRMPFRELVSMARQGRVEDMKTAVAVLMAAARLTPGS